ncbi:MAG: DUF2971 domain-containing protein [Burkholderiaceae bacterium]|nr:DUF2971 domain-containing protein [Burkholderiaceae bacterium]
MFTTVSDRSAYVYHYTSAEKAIELILPEKQLLLGSYGRTNDPKETKQWTFALSGLGQNDPYVSIDEMSRQVSTAIKTRAHILCASIDSPDVKFEIGLDIHSRGFARPRMWDQYGAKHKGVCLVFLREHLNKLIEEKFPQDFRVSRQVTYRNKSFVNNLVPSDPYVINMQHLLTVGIDQYARDHIFTHWEHLFFEKAVDWRDEHEYRWLVANNSDEMIFLNYENSLSAIVFGQDCSEVHIKEAVRLARGSGTMFEQLKWKNSAPWLSFRMDWNSF